MAPLGVDRQAGDIELQVDCLRDAAFLEFLASHDVHGDRHVLHQLLALSCAGDNHALRRLLRTGVAPAGCLGFGRLTDQCPQRHDGQGNGGHADAEVSVRGKRLAG